MCGGVHDVITGNKFHQNRLRGFRATGSKNRVLPLTWPVALTTVQHYRADCDYNTAQIPVSGECAQHDKETNSSDESKEGQSHADDDAYQHEIQRTLRYNRHTAN